MAFERADEPSTRRGQRRLERPEPGAGSGLDEVLREAPDRRLSLVRKQAAHDLRCELRRVLLDDVRGEPDSAPNQVQGFAIRVLGAYVFELQVVKTDAAMVADGLGQGETREPIGGFERRGFIHTPQRLLNRGGRRPVFEKHSELDIPLASGRVELIQADLKGAEQVHVGVVRELDLDLLPIGVMQEIEDPLPEYRRFAAQHGSDHRQRQGQAPALLDQMCRFRRQVAGVAAGRAGQDVAGLLIRQNAHRMFPSAKRGGERGIAGGEQQAGTGGLAAERLDVPVSPSVVNDDKNRFALDGRPVPIDAALFRVVAAEVVLQGLSGLAHPRYQVVGGLFPGGDPDDSIREGLLHHLVVTQRLGEDGLSGAAHTLEHSEGNVAAAALGEQGVAKSLELLGALDVVYRQRRRRDMGVQVLGLRLNALAAADVFQEPLEFLFVGRGGGEVAVVPGFKVERGFRAGQGEQGNDALARAQRSELLGAADLRCEGGRREQCEDHLRLVESFLDGFGPDVAAGEPGDIQPRVKALFAEVREETLRQLRPVLAGVRDEDPDGLLGVHPPGTTVSDSIFGGRMDSPSGHRCPVSGKGGGTAIGSLRRPPQHGRSSISRPNGAALPAVPERSEATVRSCRCQAERLLLLIDQINLGYQGATLPSLLAQGARHRHVPVNHWPDDIVKHVRHGVAR